MPNQNYGEEITVKLQKIRNIYKYRTNIICNNPASGTRFCKQHSRKG